MPLDACFFRPLELLLEMIAAGHGPPPLTPHDLEQGQPPINWILPLPMLGAHAMGQSPGTANNSQHCNGSTSAAGSRLSSVSGMQSQGDMHMQDKHGGSSRSSSGQELTSSGRVRDPRRLSLQGEAPFSMASTTGPGLNGNSDGSDPHQPGPAQAGGGMFWHASAPASPSHASQIRGSLRFSADDSGLGPQSLQEQGPGADVAAATAGGDVAAAAGGGVGGLLLRPRPSATTTTLLTSCPHWCFIHFYTGARTGLLVTGLIITCLSSVAWQAPLLPA